MAHSKPPTIQFPFVACWAEQSSSWPIAAVLCASSLYFVHMGIHVLATGKPSRFPPNLPILRGLTNAISKVTDGRKV